VINNVSGGAVTHAGVALTFGLVVMAMIYAVGDVPGAPFNPAVTFGFWLARRLPGRSVPGYAISQLADAFAARRAVVSGNLSFLWIYLAAPLFGATVAVPCWRATRG
jgi:aquaporin Z